jgi:adenosine deaminase
MSDPGASSARGNARGDARTRALPRAHLHLHLEHAMRRATLAELAAREGVALDGFFTFANLSEFLGRGAVLTGCIARPEDLARVCRELVEDEARDGVLYVEPMVLFHRWSPRLGSLDEVYALIWDALRAAGAATGVEVGMMLGFGRHRDAPAEAEVLARFAAAHAGAGIVAFGFGGDEARVGPERFAVACAIARAAGLLIVPHAGEDAGPASVRAALDALHPNRIAHGVRAVEDAVVLARLAGEGIPCDVCPTSNVLLGVASSLAEHPVAAMLRAGVPVTLNADDPLEFGTTCAEEYRRVRDTFRLTDEQLARIAATSATASGASAGTKRRIHTGIARWLHESSPKETTP